jgi:hypothetical protein
VRGEALAEEMKTLTLNQTAPADVRHALAEFSFALTVNWPLI